MCVCVCVCVCVYRIWYQFAHTGLYTITVFLRPPKKNITLFCRYY